MKTTVSSYVRGELCAAYREARRYQGAPASTYFGIEIRCAESRLIELEHYAATLARGYAQNPAWIRVRAALRRVRSRARRLGVRTKG